MNLNNSYKLHDCIACVSLSVRKVYEFKESMDESILEYFPYETSLFQTVLTQTQMKIPKILKTRHYAYYTLPFFPKNPFFTFTKIIPQQFYKFY